MTLDSQRPGGTAGVVVDRFAEFDGFMRLLRRGGSLPFHIEPAALAGTPATLASENDAVVARLPVAPEFGGGTLVLRLSPGGRWRLLGLEGLHVPAMWHHPRR